jgi:Ser/Thr protein kinase RdoA (MazF antagonist)
MPYTRYDLRNADDRIAQVKTHVDRERARLDQLEPDSPDARWVGQVLAAMERTLRQFEEHRRRIEDKLSDAGGSSDQK